MVKFYIAKENFTMHDTLSLYLGELCRKKLPSSGFRRAGKKLGFSPIDRTAVPPDQPTWRKIFFHMLAAYYYYCYFLGPVGTLLQDLSNGN